MWQLDGKWEFWECSPWWLSQLDKLKIHESTKTLHRCKRANAWLQPHAFLTEKGQFFKLLPSHFRFDDALVLTWLCRLILKMPATSLCHRYHNISQIMINHQRHQDTPKNHLISHSLGFLLCSLSTLCGLELAPRLAGSTAEQETTQDLQDPTQKTPAQCDSTLTLFVAVTLQRLKCGIFVIFDLLFCSLVCDFTAVLSTAPHSECLNKSLSLCQWSLLSVAVDHWMMRVEFHLWASWALSTSVSDALASFCSSTESVNMQQREVGTWRDVQWFLQNSSDIDITKKEQVSAAILLPFFSKARVCWKAVFSAASWGHHCRNTKKRLIPQNDRTTATQTPRWFSTFKSFNFVMQTETGLPVCPCFLQVDHQVECLLLLLHLLLKLHTKK